MTIAIIICVTFLIGLVLVLKWIKDMSTANLPMFTYGEYVWKDDEDSDDKKNTIGFVASNNDVKKTDKEIQEALMSDPITMTAALLRGEVDIDELTTRN